MKLPSTFTVERSTTVAVSPESVYAQLADFRNWPNWSPWEGLDPQMRRTYTGAEEGEGASYTWHGNAKAGSGTMTITEAQAPSSVRIDLVFEKPFPARNDTWFTVTPEGEGSRVTWSMTGPLPLPLRLVSLVRPMDKMVGPDLEKGLDQLKDHLETCRTA